MDVTFSASHPHAVNYGAYSGAQRADNIAAYGVGVQLGTAAQNPFTQAQALTAGEIGSLGVVLQSFMNNPAVLNTSSFMFPAAKGKLGPNTLTFIPEFGGFNTRSCKPCGKTFDRNITSIGQFLGPISQAYNQYYNDGGNLNMDDWLRLTYEDYAQ